MDDFETYCEVNLNPEIICRMCLEPSDNLQNIFVQEIIDGQLFPIPKLFQKVLHIRVSFIFKTTKNHPNSISIYF